MAEKLGLNIITLPQFLNERVADQRDIDCDNTHKTRHVNKCQFKGNFLQLLSYLHLTLIDALTVCNAIADLSLSLVIPPKTGSANSHVNLIPFKQTDTESTSINIA